MSLQITVQFSDQKVLLNFLIWQAATLEMMSSDAQLLD